MVTLFIHRFLRRASFVLILCLLSGSLSSCGLLKLFGREDEAPPTPPDPSGPSEIHNGNGSGYDGVRFYLYKPRYTCEKDGVRKSSYKEFVEVKGDQFFLRGDECTDELKRAGLKSELEIKDDILGLERKLYQRKSK